MVSTRSDFTGTGGVSSTAIVSRCMRGSVAGLSLLWIAFIPACFENECQDFEINTLEISRGDLLVEILRLMRDVDG